MLSRWGVRHPGNKGAMSDGCLAMAGSRPDLPCWIWFRAMWQNVVASSFGYVIVAASGTLSESPHVAERYRLADAVKAAVLVLFNWDYSDRNAVVLVACW